MQSPQFILALQNQSVWDAWTKITAVCRARCALLLSFLGAVLLGATVFSAPSRVAAQAAAATRPNIVVIMTDDQTLEMMRVLTKTRQLIGEAGTTFSNYYCSFPLCAPSRATFLTGQYPHNHGVLGNSAPGGGYEALDHSNTLPVWLQAVGYFTSHIGKYLNGYGDHNTEIPPGWNDWQTLAREAYYDYTINDNGTQVPYGSNAEDYQTDVLAGRAVETISEAVAQQPFFLSIDVHAVHGGNAGALTAKLPNPPPAPRHVDAFKDEQSPKPPSYNEANVLDKPSVIQNLPRLTAPDVEKIETAYRARLASLLAVDDLVARVVNELAATGVLNNTVIIFTSDNGLFHGEHRIVSGKGYAYEEASHLPLLIRGDGFPQGVTRNQFVANIDLAPTIVDLANASPRRVMDGRSLLPLAKDPSLANARNLLIDQENYKAVRNKSFLYVEHNSGEQELYDMRPVTTNYDPYQLLSRHADSAYSQIMAQLASRVSMLRTCLGVSCEVQ